MTAYDRRRNREIETPFGPVEIRETKWYEGEEDEHWSVVQCLDPQFDDGAMNGDVLEHFLVQYTIAKQLANEGYTLYNQIDDKNLMWVAES